MIVVSLTAGGAGGATVQRWPAGGWPDQWLDQGDQLASIISAVLSAAGIVLAYLMWGGRASLRDKGQLERTIPVAERGSQGSGSRRLAQLPCDAAWFTGRVAEFERLLAMAPDREHASTMVIGVIDGMAGIGKTALAVHAAHRLAEHYPDGQLFVDLHGYTRAVAPVEPGDALNRLLRALDVPGERIPDKVDYQAALWRSVLAGRRMLIVFDNAATEEQVRPLLPGVPGCLVMVTSRRRLAGLEATHTVSLGTLPASDAVTLFARTATQDEHAKAAHEAELEAIELCGRLPLAIKIAATRLRDHPVWTAADLVNRLRDEDQRLSELADGVRSVTAALELSYRQLPVDQQQLYLLLGLHPGPDIDPHATAVMAGITLRQARRLLDLLLGVHLIQEPTHGRYTFHDLVRAHAAATAVIELAKPKRQAALRRLLDHYRLNASLAVDITDQNGRGAAPTPPSVSTPAPTLPDSAHATEWLNTELPNLLATAQHAANHGGAEHVWHLSTILGRHMRTRGFYHDAGVLHALALTSAHTTGNRLREMDALRSLSWVHYHQGRYEQAIDHFGHALDLARSTGDHVSEVDALRGLGWVHRMQSRHQRAIDHFQQALDLARSTGDHVSEVDALRGLGWVHRMQDRYGQAIDHFQQALEIARTTGNRAGQLTALNGLGWVHLRRGQPTQASDHLQQALTTATTIGHRAGELDALNGLGHVHRLQRRYDLANGNFHRALEIARTTGHRPGELTAQVGLGHVHRLQRRYQHAIDTYQQVLTLAADIRDRNWPFEALHGLGRLHLATGQPQVALDSHHRALELASDLAQPADQARAHDGLAHAYLAQHLIIPARQHWQDALDILTSLSSYHTEEDHVSVPAIHSHLDPSRNHRPRWRSERLKELIARRRHVRS